MTGPVRIREQTWKFERRGWREIIPKEKGIWAGSRVLGSSFGGRAQYFYGFQFKLSGCLTIKLSQAVFYAKETDKMGRMLSCY